MTEQPKKTKYELRYSIGDKIMVAQWDEIDSDTQEALIEWYNVSAKHIRAKDRSLLAQLHADGNFSHWLCPECNTSILVGSPDNWDNFQGVWQSEHLGDLCADCGGLYQRLQEYAGL